VVQDAKRRDLVEHGQVHYRLEFVDVVVVEEMVRESFECRRWPAVEDSGCNSP